MWGKISPEPHNSLYITLFWVKVTFWTQVLFKNISRLYGSPSESYYLVNIITPSWIVSSCLKLHEPNWYKWLITRVICIQKMDSLLSYKYTHKILKWDFDTSSFRLQLPKHYACVNIFPRFELMWLYGFTYENFFEISVHLEIKTNE